MFATMLQPVALPVNAALRRVPAWVLYPVGMIPFALLVWHTFTNGLGPDPTKAIELQLGKLGLQLIVAGLCVTPLRRLTGINLIRYRRAVGLLAFTYICLHLTTWVFLDLQMRWGLIGSELIKRPFIIVGMIGLAMMLPLAITSNNLSIRKLGPKAWQRLHQLTYLVSIAAAVHYIMLTKTWRSDPVVYAAIITSLLVLRVVWAWWPARRQRA
jgi:sulfoxide reductase heme-binding subunit YedZ